MPTTSDLELISTKVIDLAQMVVGSQDKIDQRFIKVFEELSGIKVSLARIDERTSAVREDLDASKETSWKWVSLIFSVIAVAVSIILGIIRK